MKFSNKNYKKIHDFSQNLYENKTINKPKIVVVTKNRPISCVLQAIESGVRFFAENRLQEAVLKYSEIKRKYTDIELHMTGPMQTNKVKKSLEIFDVFHTLDREKLALEFSKHISNFSTKNEKSFFIQVNTGNESQKSGISLDSLKGFVEYCINDLDIKVIGLMCIPPISEDAKKHFILLKDLAQKNNLNKLSMGMSADYEIALNCGSTHIRVGSILFTN